jgi:hypothetical protein
MGSRSSSITDAKPGDVVDIEIDWRFFDLGCLRTMTPNARATSMLRPAPISPNRSCVGRQQSDNEASAWYPPNIIDTSCNLRSESDKRARRAAQGCAYSRRPRSRSAFVTTETELSDMARAAIIGESRMPNAGYRMPAAIGTPSTL